MSTPSPRVLEHLERLRSAGNVEAFFNALVELREDSSLPDPHREALRQLIAQESFIWYLEALRGDRVDREKLAAAAKRLREASGAAIDQRTPSQLASDLLAEDIGVTKGG